MKSLPGKIGSQDVNDCHDACLHILSLSFPSFNLDKDNVFITGGSHGGFLTCHLIGQFPGFYKAAATRNPVCNIASMVSVTDIPDWCYVEAGLPASTTGFTAPSEEALVTMDRASPIAHVTRVKTPTLILIGAKDRRGMLKHPLTEAYLSPA